jgi:glycosyltransferase involved in cell wall biosynthesis
MRVALLSHSARTGDAIGNSVAQKLGFFLERGAEVRVFLESVKAVHPTVGPFCQVMDPVPQGEGWRFLSSADLVVVEYGQFYALLDLLPLLARGKPRILLDYYGVTPPELWGPHNREALIKGVSNRGLAGFADAVIVHSRVTERELRDQVGLPADRLVRMGFPLDLGFWSPGLGPTPLRQKLGLEGASILLFVGRLAPNKRVPLLVEALGRLRALVPQVHAVVVGDTGDLYQAQADLCQQRATALGVADRLHLLGTIPDEALREAYRTADVLVMPSLAEGFCIPVIEAMACGVPVLAARAGALPETVGDAGLTFAADDAEDLVRQLRKILCGPLSQPIEILAGPRHVAIVTNRFGDGFAGGAERSLRTIAESLHQAGHAVEVFATCCGTAAVKGIPVHRFQLDEGNPDGNQAALGEIQLARVAVPLETEERFLASLPGSPPLLKALTARQDEFDVILCGPYLSGLAVQVCRALPRKSVLVPCFHDEPLARLACWPLTYREVAGIFYHSIEEQELAQGDLGLNHPHGRVLGTFLDSIAEVPPLAKKVPVGGRYVVYCGRYHRDKGVAILLENARRYSTSHPGRFTFVFVGEGDMPIPQEEWARDLGFLSEDDKRAVLAGADALVQLSPHESLSLVALEAWAQGTPIIASARCAVLVGHLDRGKGGCAVTGYDDFARALDDLWRCPEAWQDRGRQGRLYVKEAFGSREKFLTRLEGAFRDLTNPAADQMRRRGLERVQKFSAPAWREDFARLADRVLHEPARLHRHLVEVRRRSATRVVRAGTDSILAAVRVHNWGTHPVVAEGPGRTVLRFRVRDEQGQELPLPGPHTPLPGLLRPGQSRAAAIPVPIPAIPGVYQVDLWAEGIRTDEEAEPDLPPGEGAYFRTSFRLVVAADASIEAAPCCSAVLEAASADLAEAQRLQRLPDDYLDVTEGLLASLKRRLKRKLLGNFKHAYVDVLSRQQSAFNRQILSVLAELAECCASLDHAVCQLQGQLARKSPRRGKQKKAIAEAEVCQ